MTNWPASDANVKMLLAFPTNSKILDVEINND